ncbi:MAG: hypothetical protein JWL65_4482 [Gammaproteobacteria bacterium]|nr:hypothetical protein [Gammaproteobacteria bacterium]
MDNPLQMLLPLAGFIGGIVLWSRVAHLAIALSGLTPNPSNPAKDLGAMEKSYRRVVISIAGGWLCIIGAALTYTLQHDNTDWALLLGGILAVPLFTVTNFLVIARRHRRRAATLKAQSPN